MAYLVFSFNMNIRNVFSSSAINLAYQIIPALSALIMVPLTIKWYGTERFSVFSLAVSVIVLFNYLNFGVAQSTSRELSKVFDNKEESKSSSIITSGIIAIVIIGLFTSVIGCFASASIANLLTKNDPKLYQETSIMIETVLLWSPLFLIVILFRGILESKLLFKYTSLNRALLNTLIFISPAICYTINVKIIYSMYFIVITHLISAVLLLLLIINEFRGVYFSFSKEMFHKLLISGGWLTLISLSSIGFLYADKFIIGSVLGLATLAYYVAAYDLISRSSILYGSISAAFFPAFSYWIEKKDICSLQDSIKYLVVIISIVMGIALSFVILFSHEIIYYWIDDKFSDSTSLLLRILSVGILFSSLSIVYMRLLCAAGNEKLVAIFYLVQAFIYVPASFFVATNYGNEGVAWLFSLRCLIELLMLMLFSSRIIDGLSVFFEKNIFFVMFSLFFVVVSFWLSDSTVQVRFFIMLSIISSGLIFFYLERIGFKKALDQRVI